jgi:hypothetical protein
MTPVWDRKPAHMAGGTAGAGDGTAGSGGGGGMSALDGMAGAHGKGALSVAAAGPSSGGASGGPAAHSDRVATSDVMHMPAATGAAGASHAPVAASTAALSGVSPRMGDGSGSAGAGHGGISRGTVDASHGSAGAAGATAALPHDRAKLAWVDGGGSPASDLTSGAGGVGIIAGNSRIASSPASSSPAALSASGSSTAAVARLAYFIGVQFEVRCRGVAKMEEGGRGNRHAALLVRPRHASLAVGAGDG